MPYCPKCGVELDYNVKNCPLCTFPIPKITDEEDPYSKIKSSFPEPENIYYEKLIKMKNQFFFTISILFFSAILILLTIDSIINLQPHIVYYSILSIVAAEFYIFFLLGYVQNIYYSILSIGIVTLMFTFGLDYVDKVISWASTYALPIVIISILTLFFILYLYNKSKLKNKFVFVPTYLCIGISLFSVVLECTLDYQSTQNIKLSWSLIVTIVLMSIALLLVSLYYKLPDRLKEKIIRALHI